MRERERERERMYKKSDLRYDLDKYPVVLLLIVTKRNGIFRLSAPKIFMVKNKNAVFTTITNIYPDIENVLYNLLWYHNI